MEAEEIDLNQIARHFGVPEATLMEYKSETFMIDNELTQQLQDKREELAKLEKDMVTLTDHKAYLKAQIKAFEAEQKRREKWAQKVNGKQE